MAVKVSWALRQTDLACPPAPASDYPFPSQRPTLARIDGIVRGAGLHSLFSSRPWSLQTKDVSSTQLVRPGQSPILLKSPAFSSLNAPRIRDSDPAARGKSRPRPPSSGHVAPILEPFFNVFRSR